MKSQNFEDNNSPEYQVWSKNLTKFLLISLVLHLLGAYFSQGWHKLDEYGGIITNTAWKLNILDASYLNPGEFPGKIRTWIQPGLYYMLAKVFNVLGVENPFTLAFIFRLFSSILGWLSIAALAKLSYRFTKNAFARNTSLFFLATIWYFPFFHARTTGENLGASAFIFGLYLLLKNAPDDIFENHNLKKLNIFGSYSAGIMTALAAGILFGFSFLFRFQMSVMIFFFTLWFLLYSSASFATIVNITLGFAIAFGLGILMDHWGYGVWTLSVWNYWDFNIVQGVASALGVDPWWKYLYKTLIKGIPPFSLLFLVPFFWMAIKKPGHMITWLTIPFFIVHSAIAHKELRFIYVLGLYAPIAIAIFFEHFHTGKKILEKKLYRRLYTFLILQNIVALIVATTKPAYSQIDFWKYLYKNPIKEVHVVHEIPKVLRFYLKEDLNQIKINSFEEIAEKAQDKEVWLYSNRYPHIEEIKKLGICKRIYSSYPDWVLNFNIGNWLKRSRVWSLHKCYKGTP